MLDEYCRREWLSAQDYEKAGHQFIGETIRLLRLRLLRIVPVKTGLLIQARPLAEKYHIYEADALQVVSAEHVNAEGLYTGDKQVDKVAVEEGITSTYLG